MAAILDVGMERILAVLNFHISPMQGCDWSASQGEQSYRKPRKTPIPRPKHVVSEHFRSNQQHFVLEKWSQKEKIFLKEEQSHPCQCLPPSFSFIRLTVREQMSVQDFQAGHLRHLNRTILAILNFIVTPMPPIKFGLSPTRFRSHGGPSLKSERNDFSNSEFLYCSDAQFDLWFGRGFHLKNFKIATVVAAILNIGRKRF